MSGGELFNLVISLKFQLKSKYILLVNVLICVLWQFYLKCECEHVFTEILMFLGKIFSYKCHKNAKDFGKHDLCTFQ